MAGVVEQMVCHINKKRGQRTTLEPCLVQASVRGGLPVQEQVKAASIPMSTVWGLGSVSSLGPTAKSKNREFTLRSHFITAHLCAHESHYNVLICNLIKTNMQEYVKEMKVIGMSARGYPMVLYVKRKRCDRFFLH